MARQCPTPTAEGRSCRGRVPPGRVYCLSHDPERKESQREASRRGGEARANARRAARQWAAIGEAMRPEDLPAMLRAAMLSVKAGTLEPGQAQAIAALARTSLQLTNDLDVDKRLAALEEALGAAEVPENVRRIG